MHRSALALLTATCLTGFVSSSHASPSGLNNIPTADTTPQGTFVLQTYSTVFGEADSDFNIGFKTGLDFKYAHLEFGADSHLLQGNGGPVTANVKLAVPLGEHLPTFAIGGANTTFRTEDRARTGDEFFYSVVTEDLRWFRVHGGCGLQDGIALPFYGIDKRFQYHRQVAAEHDGKLVRDGKSIADGKSGKDMMMTTQAIDLFTLRGDAISNRTAAGSTPRAYSFPSANTSFWRPGPTSRITAPAPPGRSKAISSSRSNTSPHHEHRIPTAILPA